MGMFRSAPAPLSPIPSEDSEPRKPARIANSFESTSSSKTRTNEVAIGMPFRTNSAPPEQQPRLLTRMPSTQTQYMDMLLHLDQIPRLHNILAAAFTWILLAGFLVIPGTFTSFKNSDAFKNSNNNDALEQKILHSVANIGLLWVSGVCCVTGLLGCCWLWFVWRKNYIWLINRIFLYDQFPLQSRMC
jgi:hypothetical protein